MSQNDEIIELLERSSNFTLRLLTREEKWGPESDSFKIHKTVLLPLLSMADGCWAYGIEKDSEVWKSAFEILVAEKGKFKVSLSGDPVTGREFFWNAHSGKRGSIVITVPIEKFDANKIFKACRGVMVFTNYRSGHSSSAIKYAQKMLPLKTHLVFCLPRNNGIEWVEVFAPKPLVFSLYGQALELCGQ